VKDKSKAITEREGQISTLENKLDKKMKELKYAYVAHKITKKKYEQQQQQIKQEADQKISSLVSANEQAQKELYSASHQLKETSVKLNQAQGTVAKLGEQNAHLEGELKDIDAKHATEVEQMKGQAAQQRDRDRAQFEAQLAKEKLSGEEKAAREAAFKAQAEKKSKDLAGQIASLDQKYRDSQGALAKATENLNARKNLAKQIKANFEKYGVAADVDAGTGDVLLSFGDQYFNTGQADLKPRMRKILEQAVPAYSASLFQDPKVAKKIQSVEIVGFASPTYKGKYVDPSSLDPDNRQAVNYNLDLSYNRARSIFNYVFDRNKMAFKYQETLLPLVKVSGRSFLASDKRDPANAKGTGEDFCRHNDCAKLQKVIIKFNLKD
jgi:outer membrane protein OmpA-like peptidoglycan-associated protein